MSNKCSEVKRILKEYVPPNVVEVESGMKQKYSSIVQVCQNLNW